jgi:hypothetical protein
MDTLITYAFIKSKHKAACLKELYKVRKFNKKDLPFLINIAKHAFSKSRFHSDYFLSQTKSSFLYGEWIKTYCLKSEPVFVITKSSGVPAGFLTYKLNRELADVLRFKIMGQGLLAVEPKIKGGLISLMAATFKEADRHYDCVEYDTRLNNYEVTRACRRMGLDLVRAKHAFHLNLS